MVPSRGDMIGERRAGVAGLRFEARFYWYFSYECAQDLEEEDSGWVSVSIVGRVEQVASSLACVGRVFSAWHLPYLARCLRSVLVVNEGVTALTVFGVRTFTLLCIWLPL